MSSNEDLSKIFDRIANGKQSDDDIKTLRKRLQLQDGEKVIQLGSKIINISEGRDIQIGDRIYQGADAETIEEALRLVLQEKQKGKRLRTEKLLLQAVKDEVTARLNQSLHNAVSINLGKEAQSQQVKHPWSSDIKITKNTSETIPDNTTILEIFDQEEIAGKLLILGNPGAGKTTTMLDLAKDLVTRSEQLADYPIPVLLNLSTWKDNKQSIRDWLIQELKSKYGVLKDIGASWIDDAKLLPMLDGLDELESIRQELCVRKINQFLQSDYRSSYLVVCSRREEYEKVVRQQIELEETSSENTRLHLNGSVCLQPLTNEQIKAYLTELNHIELWKTLQIDTELLELVRTSLFLSILGFISFYKTLSLDEWRKLTSTELRLQYLLDTYWEAAINRELATPQMELQGFKSRSYGNKKFPNTRQTRKWLVYLAQQLQRESQTEFLIETMQPHILSKKVHQWFYFFLIFASNIVFCGIISITALLPYSPPPNNQVIIPGILILGFFGSFILTTQNKADGLRLILYPWVHLFCWLFKLKLPKYFDQHIPIIHEIELSHRLSLRIPSLQDIEIFFIIPLRTLSFLISRTSLIPIIPLIYSTHILLGGLIYSIGLKKIARKIEITLKKINKNVNRQLKGYEDSRYPHHDFIFLLTIEYFNLIEKGGYLPNAILKFIGGFFSVLICIFIAPISLIPLFFVKPVENSTIPNQSFYEEFKIALFLTLIQGFYAYYLMSTNIEPTIGHKIISFGLCIILSFTFLSLIKHLSLRFILYFNNYIPWNYARFLNYCTERLFLQRVGGRYRFIHRLLQEHFATMPLNK